MEEINMPARSIRHPVQVPTVIRLLALDIQEQQALIRLSEVYAEMINERGADPRRLLNQCTPLT